jgi:hypothetical protein
MPRYEFVCETCKQPFELLLTISEREKGDMQGHEGRAAARRLHGADVEEELRLRGAGPCPTRSSDPTRLLFDPPPAVMCIGP